MGENVFICDKNNLQPHIKWVYSNICDFMKRGEEVVEKHKIFL